MTIGKRLLRRLTIGVITIWAVLSVMFGLLFGTGNWAWGRTEGPMRFAGATDEEIHDARDQFYAERGIDGSLPELYVEWIVNMFTLQWGESWVSGEPVAPMVASATLRTAMYVLPAIVLAVMGGIFLGTFAAIRKGSTTEGIGRISGYLLFGLPNFWIGAMILMAMLGAGSIAFRRHEAVVPTVELPFVYEYLLPIFLVTTTLFAGLLTAARAQSLEYTMTDVTKLVRAKGGGSITVARHVLRNAAIPLVSLIFTETLALLVLSVFVVEALFGINGLGLIFYNAVWEQDIPVLLAGTMVIVAFGVLGNIIQDLSHTILDPRIGTDS